MIPRVLEPEVMDSADEAVDYNSMDHSEVNRRFVADLLATDPDLNDVLDVGTGTALIPIELYRQSPAALVTAVDAAAHMLQLGRDNVEQAGLSERVSLAIVDARRLPYADGRFSAVISNSIVHHIPDPFEVMQEAVRVCASQGTIFFRDLLRPDDLPMLRHLVDTYAAGANVHQRQMFADSLHAALTLEEIRNFVSQLGFNADSVTATSDRHWTWRSRR